MTSNFTPNFALYNPLFPSLLFSPFPLQKPDSLETITTNKTINNKIEDKNKKLNEKKNYNLNLKDNMKKILNKLDCPLCSFVGNSKQDLNQHLQVCHQTFRCLVCNFSSRCQAKLNKHLTENHDKDGSQNLKVSERKKSKKTRNYSCKQCRFTTYNQESMWLHTKVHVPASKLLTCPRCPFVCAFKHHMQYHLNNHFGFKPYKCELCNYRCNNRSMLNSHLKSHSNEYPFRCQKCSYVSKYRQALYIHTIKMNHASEEIEDMGQESVDPIPSDQISTKSENCFKNHSENSSVSEENNFFLKEESSSSQSQEPLTLSNSHSEIFKKLTNFCFYEQIIQNSQNISFLNNKNSHFHKFLQHLALLSTLSKSNSVTMNHQINFNFNSLPLNLSQNL